MMHFTGLHEVVCKRANGKLYIGFFDKDKAKEREYVTQ